MASDQSHAQQIHLDLIDYSLCSYWRFWTQWAGMLLVFQLRMQPSSVALTLNTGLRGSSAQSVFSSASFVFLISCLSYHECMFALTIFVVRVRICMLMYIKWGWIWDESSLTDDCLSVIIDSINSSLTFSIAVLTLSHKPIVILLCVISLYFMYGMHRMSFMPEEWVLQLYYMCISKFWS